MPLKPEQLLQIAVFDFAKLNKLLMIHVPNEGKRTDHGGHLLKRMGLYPGFSDCFFPKSNKSYKGLFIELKIKPNKPTENQIKFLEEMIAIGYDGCVCYSIDEVMSVLKQFYSLTPY